VRSNGVKVLYVNNQRLSTGWPDIGTFDDRLFARAVNGALEKLKGQDINVGVAFAEHRKTGALIASVASSIAKGLEKFRDLKKGKLWDLVKSVTPGVTEYPQEYLAMSYGWNPLLSDVDGACKELSGLTERIEHPYWVEVTGTGKESSSTSDWLTWCWAIAGGTKYLYGTKSRDEKARAVFRYRLENPTLQKFSELGLTNPASIAWEVLPFSFVLDWALPVGSWINLLDADYGWLYLNGSVSRILRERQMGSHFAPLGTGWSLVSGSAASIQWNSFRFQRYVQHTPPTAYYPTFRNPYSVSGVPKRVADSLALLAQAFR
jgi:hypothetical protein